LYLPGDVVVFYGYVLKELQIGKHVLTLEHALCGGWVPSAESGETEVSNCKD
jgi:hypothetical protein